MFSAMLTLSGEIKTFALSVCFLTARSRSKVKALSRATFSAFFSSTGTTGVMCRVVSSVIPGVGFGFGSGIGSLPSDLHPAATSRVSSPA